MAEPRAEPSSDAPIEGFPRPVGFSETASIAWTLYRARIASLLPSTLAVYVIFSLAQLTLLNAIVLLDLSRGPQFAVTVLPVYVAPTVLASVVFALVSISVARALVGDRPEKPRLSWIGGRTLPILRLGWVSGVVFVAALVIGPAFQVFYPLFYGPAVFVQVAALEPEIKPGRARSLLSGQWGRVIFYLLPVAAVVGVATLVLPITAFTALEEFSSILAFFAVVAVQGVLWAVMLPFVAAFEVVQYLDLRARAEELDRNELKTELTASTRD